MSLKEYLENPANKARIAGIIAARKATKDSYDANTWFKAKKIFSTMLFPDAQMQNEIMRPDYKMPSQGEYHGIERNSHALQTHYMRGKNTIDGFQVWWKYSFCTECKKFVSKKGTLINNHENEVYQKWFVKHGELISQQMPAMPNINANELFTGKVVG